MFFLVTSVPRLRETSSTRFPLQPGKKLIAAVFYELREDEISEVQPVEANIEDFPDELVRLIQNYRPVVLQTLEESLIETQRQLTDLRNEITSGREWQRQFQASLDRHDAQIDKLLRGLEEEKKTEKTPRTLSKRSSPQYKRERGNWLLRWGRLSVGLRCS